MSAIEVGYINIEVDKITDSVDVSHPYYNASDKEIKYVTFTYVPYNAVKDVVSCTASGKIEVSGQLTGPIPPKTKSYVQWENMWFNPTVESAELTRVRVQYMDGTEEVIEGEDIACIHDKDSVYYQEVGKKEEEKRAAAAAKRQEELEKRREREAKAKAEQAKKDKRTKIIGWVVLGAIALYLLYSLVSGLSV